MAIRVAVIPAKALAGSKMRLARVLDDDARRALVLAMLRDVIATCRESGCFAEIVVVGGDDEVMRTASDADATAIPEPVASGLNDAVSRGLRYARERGADEVLVVPADVPQVTAEDVRGILAASAARHGPAFIAVVRARDGGTNALVLRPPDVIEPAFGAQSADAHLAGARARGIAGAELPLPRLAFDVDTPDDLRVLGHLSVGASTADWLARWAASTR